MHHVVTAALGETATDSRHILTEPGRGYRFVALLPEPGVCRVSRRMTDNPQAYQLYLAGWSAMTRPGQGNLQRGIKRLEEAVHLDPGFALAHAGIADGYALLSSFGVARPRDVIVKARAAVRRAMELDRELAEAHAALGNIQAVLELDMPAAEMSLQRALQIDPQSAMAHYYLGLVTMALGRLDDALKHFHLAQVAEPLAPNISTAIGAVHYRAGRHDEAIAQLEAALELDPDYALTHSMLGRCYLRISEFDRAIAEFERCAHPTIASASDIPSAYALCGRIDDARAALQALMASSNSQYVSPFDIATIYAALRESDLALAWLEKAVDEVAAPIMLLKVDPPFAQLREDPRFVSLLKRMRVS